MKQRKNVSRIHIIGTYKIKLPIYIERKLRCLIMLLKYYIVILNLPSLCKAFYQRLLLQWNCQLTGNWMSDAMSPPSVHFSISSQSHHQISRTPHFHLKVCMLGPFCSFHSSSKLNVLKTLITRYVTKNNEAINRQKLKIYLFYLVHYCFYFLI